MAKKKKKNELLITDSFHLLSLRTLHKKKRLISHFISGEFNNAHFHCLEDDTGNRCINPPQLLQG